MSELDHMTDEDLRSMTTKLDMANTQRELSDARIEVLLDMMGDERPTFDVLNEKAKALLSINHEREEIEQRPPRMEPMDD